MLALVLSAACTHETADGGESGEGEGESESETGLDGVCEFESPFLCECLFDEWV